jgi:hypothetical protein
MEEQAMRRMKRILVNEYEEVTHATLLDATSRSGAKVFAKVRVADVLCIDKSGISNHEYRYALSSHFDFVVTDASSDPEFVVEFDGPQHRTDPSTIERDAIKNALCERFGLPILRIDAGYLRQIGRFRLIGWLTEVWFLNKAFCEAQERGEIDPTEIFHYSFILGMGYRQDGRIVEIEDPDPVKVLEKVEALRQANVKVGVIRPYDPFIEYRAFIHALYEKGKCKKPVPEMLVALHPESYYVAVAIVELPDGKAIIGEGQCYISRFPAAPPSELCEELAVMDACEKLKKYVIGKHEPSLANKVEEMRRRMSQWDRFR